MTAPFSWPHYTKSDLAMIAGEAERGPASGGWIVAGFILGGWIVGGLVWVMI